MSADDVRVVANLLDKMREEAVKAGRGVMLSWEDANGFALTLHAAADRLAALPAAPPTLTQEQVEALLTAGHTPAPYVQTYTTASAAAPPSGATTVENLKRQVARWRKRAFAAEDRFERCATDGRWLIEVEEGAACVAFFGDITVTNSQHSVAQCFDDAYAKVWGEGGVMRPEFQARLNESRARLTAAQEAGAREVLRSFIARNTDPMDMTPEDTAQYSAWFYATPTTTDPTR